MEKGSRKETRGKKTESADSTTETKVVDAKLKAKAVPKKVKEAPKALEKNGDAESPAVENGASNKGKGDNVKETAAAKVKKPNGKAGSGKICFTLWFRGL